MIMYFWNVFKQIRKCGWWQWRILVVHNISKIQSIMPFYSYNVWTHRCCMLNPFWICNNPRLIALFCKNTNWSMFFYAEPHKKFCNLTMSIQKIIQCLSSVLINNFLLDLKANNADTPNMIVLPNLIASQLLFLSISKYLNKILS